MDKEIERLHRRLRRNKLAVFLIISFLALLTYLLIVVSGQISSEQALLQVTQASSIQQPSSPDIRPIDPIIDKSLPKDPITCTNYADTINKLRQHLYALKYAAGGLNCPIELKPANETSPQSINAIDSCLIINDLATYINGLEQTIAKLCASCPAPTAIPQKPIPSGIQPY